MLRYGSFVCKVMDVTLRFERINGVKSKADNGLCPNRKEWFSPYFWLSIGYYG